MHTESSPLAGKTVKLKKDLAKIGGCNFIVEDWFDNKYVGGKSWMFSDGNPGALIYALRTAATGNMSVPLDDEVLYGFVEGHGKFLIHISEIDH